MSDWIPIGEVLDGAAGEQGIPGTTGADGQPGDRFFVYAEPTSDPAFWTIFRIRQVWNGSDYENTGFPVPMVTVPVTATAGQTHAVFIMPRLRQDPGVDWIAYPEGQYNYIELATGEVTPAGGWFTIGDVLIAPRGEQGEPGIPGEDGEPGATGESTIIIYNAAPQLPNKGEAKTWSYLARRTVDWLAYTAQIADENSPIDEIISGLYRFATFFAPTETIFEIWGGFTPGMKEAVQGEIAKSAAALLIFCDLVTNMQQADIQIDALHLAAGDPRQYSASPSQAAECIRAACWEQAALKKDVWRSLLANWRLQASTQDTLPDYSTVTTCFPPYEDWNHVFDFTLGNQGWQIGINSNNVNAIYVPGEGWRGDGVVSFGLHYTFPAAVQLRQIEVIWVDPRNNAHRFGDGGAFGESYHNLTEVYPNGSQNPLIVAWQGDINAGSMAVQADNYLTSTRLVRVSIAGTGFNPWA